VHSAQRFVSTRAEPNHDLYTLRVGVAFALVSVVVSRVAEDVVAQLVRHHGAGVG